MIDEEGGRSEGEREGEREEETPKLRHQTSSCCGREGREVMDTNSIKSSLIEYGIVFINTLGTALTNFRVFYFTCCFLNIVILALI
jgi:hypothetical protein